MIATSASYPACAFGVGEAGRTRWRDERQLRGDEMTVGTFKAVVGSDRRASLAGDPPRRALDVRPGTADSAVMDWPSRRISLVKVFAVGTAFGVFSTLQAYNYITLFTDEKQPFHILLALNITYWYAWAVLVPGVLWMARRYRFGRHTWKRAAAMHAGGVIVFTLAHAALTVTCRVLIMKAFAGRDVSWWLYFQELFFLYFDWEMMTYWAVVGLSHALDFHRESQERELTAAQLRTRLAEATLQALQRQLHPHFLFNTLHTISALMHRDIEAADAMLERLSDLLRLTLDRVGTQLVSLKDELDFLGKYLKIEQTRFGDRLQIHINVEPDTLDAAVPNLVLQPLVENALRHGIGPKIGGGRLDVLARRDGRDLWLEVRDNGVGLTTDAFHNGVGLTNTRSRLEHLYGDRYRFECETPPGGGLLVRLVIPFTADGPGPSAALGPERSDMESVA
jgi:signal transduction histidine kinase